VLVVDWPLGSAGGGPVVATIGERTLAALQSLLRSSHLAGPDDLPALVATAGGHLGADLAVVYLADYEQISLVPLQPGPALLEGDGPWNDSRLDIEGTLAGRSFTDVQQRTSDTTVWTPVLDGTERLGVLQLDFPSAGGNFENELLSACADVATLIAELVSTRSRYGDSVERARRRRGLSLPAEMQWRHLPPLTFVSRRASISGILLPAEDVAGDCFDYALNDNTLHVAIIDAMGHGMQATLLSAVAISAMRNARRGGVDLPGILQGMELAIASHFGPGKFVTAIVGELNLNTGWWRWVTCGHPPALVVRDARVVKQLDSVINPPIGVGFLGDHPTVGEERLQPGDRLLLHTDGVTEARNSEGEFFGIDRLAALTGRQSADRRPAAETLRRLNQAVLAHQHGKLQDDATTVLLEWLGDQPAASTV
jgi:serine phosphatase RsbU (regulator of sigma subunit)